MAHMERIEVNTRSEWGNLVWYLMYLLTAVGLTPGGSSTVHIYAQTIHKTAQ